MLSLATASLWRLSLNCSSSIAIHNISGNKKKHLASLSIVLFERKIARTQAKYRKYRNAGVHAFGSITTS